MASIHTTGGAEIPSNTTNSTKKTATGERQSRGDSVNQVTLIGRLVATPELRETDFGKSVRVATNGKNHAEFPDVVLWGNLASFACSYLGKGRLVYIEGRLQSRQW
jgi:single-stranded DNA-binding protein